MNLGDRLREERERLGYTQPAFAEVAGAKKHAQINWEKGAAFPNAAALEAWSKVGLDVLYVVTGQRAGGVKPAPTLTAEEETMLGYFRDASKEVRRAALGALLGASAGAPAPVGGPHIGAVHGGSVTQGNVSNMGPVTFHARPKPRK